MEETAWGVNEGVSEDLSEEEVSKEAFLEEVAESGGYQKGAWKKVKALDCLVVSAPVRIGIRMIWTDCLSNSVINVIQNFWTTSMAGQVKEETALAF